MNRVRAMIVAGKCGARRVPSRRPGAHGSTAGWRTLTLHWRKTRRWRAPDRETMQAASWTSIFAPRFLLHFHSQLTTAAYSTLFATTSAILKPLLTQRSSFLHHREARHTHFSRERLFSRPGETPGPVTRVSLIHGSLPQRSADPAVRTEPSPLPRPARNLFLTKSFHLCTARISPIVTHYTRHSVSSLVMAVTPAMHLRESPHPASHHSVESARIIQRTDMIWRQPPAAAKPETRDFHRSAGTPSQSHVRAFDSPGVSKTPAKTTQPSTAPAFDASQMDRFVENVIGRVEKRLRIEQERRGN